MTWAIRRIALIYVATPWVQVDLTRGDRGRLIPWKPPAADPANPRAYTARIQGRPPVESIVPGVFDIFVFDARDPAAFMKEISTLTGPAVMPPKWSLGYMQSHRTLEDEKQLIDIVDTFRSKKIPIDSVVYLGTGFCPRGWNTRQPSFTFNPEVFKRDPRETIADLHARHVKVVVHIVPWGRDLLVAPVCEKGASVRDVYLPRGDWYDFWTDVREAGGRTVRRPVDLATMPIYVRAGAIIPFDPVRQYSNQEVAEPTTIRIYSGADGRFTMYEDDGISPDYLRGKASWTRLLWNDAAKRLTIEPGTPSGPAAGGAPAMRTFRVQLLPAGSVKEVNYRGRRVTISFQRGGSSGRPT